MVTPVRISVVVTAFLFFSIFGCSSGSGGSTLQSTVSEPTPDVKIFSSGKQRIYTMAVTALQKLGYVVTVSDPQTGLLTAERFMNAPILEDPAGALQPEKKMSAGDVLLVILSIVLIFGIIFIIIDAASGTDNDKQKKRDASSSGNEHEGYERHHHDADETPVPVMGYKYSLSLKFTAMSDSATRIRTTVTKVTFSNGSPSGSVVISSSAILNELYRALENEIYFAP